MQAYKKLENRAISLNSWRSLVLFLTIAFAVATLASLIIEPALSDWYTGLEKPSFTPRAWIFASVSSYIYSSMAIAFWQIFRKRQLSNIRHAVWLYHLQLLLNLAWTAAFFGMHNPGLAFGVAVILQLANFGTAIEFYRIDKLAGFIFIPYIWFVSLAAVLNFYIWIAN